MILFSIAIASGFLRWNELRPIIEPKPPPSRIALTSANRDSSSLFGPPEKITMRRPSKAALHDVADALGQRLERNLLRFVNLFRSRLFEMGARQLDLNYIGAELGRDLPA